VFARSGLVTGSLEAIAAEVAARARSLQPSEVWIAVGEPVVRVRGGGRGGRAQHLAMEVARRIAGCGPSIAFLALGSDGTDGPTFAAGALVDGTTWPADAGGRVAAETALARCDSHTWLRDRGALLVTGDTGTNLTDLYVLARGPL
jgi:glycerate-2-kinase